MKKLISYADLQAISTNAKNNYVRQSIPLEISLKPVETEYLACIATIDAVLMYLSKNKLLTEDVRLDYSRSNDGFEGLE